MTSNHFIVPTSLKMTSQTNTTSTITICPKGPHYCDEALNNEECPHGVCEIAHCRKHTQEHHAIILKQKGLTKCDECGGIEGKNCDCEDDKKDHACCEKWCERCK